MKHSLGLSKEPNVSLSGATKTCVYYKSRSAIKRKERVREQSKIIANRKTDGKSQTRKSIIKTDTVKKGKVKQNGKRGKKEIKNKL